MKKIILLLALLLCYVASFCQLKTITNELDVKGKFKVSLDTSVNVFTRISLNDSSVQAATTAWVKKQLYGSNSSQGLFKRFAIPFGSSTGSLTQDSAAFNFTNGVLSLNSGSLNSLFLNNFRTEIQGSSGGFIFNVGSGYPGGGNYDQSKSYQFMNRGYVYLSMATAGAVSTSTFNTNLVVNGSLKITGGVPGAGKVLTSDAVGLASWQVPSGGGGGGSTDTSSLSNRIDLKAAIASPTFTGFPAAPTQPTGTSNTTLATTQFVQNSLAPQIQPAGTIFGNASITDAIPTFTTTPYIAGSLKIGTNNTTDPSALLDLSSINKGFLLPRLTTAQMNAIASPAAGLKIYNTTDGVEYYYNGTGWVAGLTNGIQTITGNKSIPNLNINVLSGINTGAYANLALYQGSPLLTIYSAMFAANNQSVGNITSGIKRIFYDNSIFQPTSGTATLAAFEDNGVTNQTGTANGTTWGFKANRTLTAAANYIAFEAVVGKIVFSATNTAAGTTGAQTINKISGKVNAAAGTTSIVVTNNLVSANSIVISQFGTNDATARIISTVEAAGSFTINYSAPTNESVIKFLVIN